MSKLDSFSDGRGIDLVILTANPWPAYRTAVSIVRPNGRVSIVSLSGRGEPPLDFNPLAMEYFYIKGISLIAINHPAAIQYPTAYEPLSYQGTYDQNHHRAHLFTLMAQGLLEPKRLVTHRLHYTKIAEAYEMALSRDKSMMNVVFDWSDA